MVEMYRWREEGDREMVLWRPSRHGVR
jgi:hypothetical protein